MNFAEMIKDAVGKTQLYAIKLAIKCFFSSWPRKTEVMRVFFGYSSTAAKKGTPDRRLAFCKFNYLKNLFRFSQL